MSWLRAWRLTLDSIRLRVEAINTELTNHAEGGTLDTAVLGIVDQIIQANQSLQQQLKKAEVKLQEQAEQIEAQAADAMTDALTGAPNRRYFDTELCATGDRMATQGNAILPDDDRCRSLQEIQ